MQTYNLFNLCSVICMFVLWIDVIDDLPLHSQTSLVVCRSLCGVKMFSLLHYCSLPKLSQKRKLPSPQVAPAKYLCRLRRYSILE